MEVDFGGTEDHWGIAGGAANRKKGQEAGEIPRAGLETK